jgi:putative ABC transport system substrate-binding protein
MVVNMKTAKALGLTIPKTVLVREDRSSRSWSGHAVAITRAEGRQSVARRSHLWWSEGTNTPVEDAFLAGMKEHGYDVGRNLIVDVRYAEGELSRYPALVDEIIALKPDVLLGANTGAARAMKQKTTTIPIVLGTSGDPVGDGLVHSLSRPGGNVTGVSLQLGETSAKHVEMMGELLPRMRRLGVLLDASGAKAQNDTYLRLAKETSAAKGFALEVHQADKLNELRQVFRRMEKQRLDALLVVLSPRFFFMRAEIARQALAARLPSITFVDEYANDGGLMTYGPSFVDAMRRAAYFAHRIFTARNRATCRWSSRRNSRSS